MLKINMKTEEKITKTKKQRKISLTFEKKKHKFLSYIFKLIKSFL